MENSQHRYDIGDDIRPEKSLHLPGQVGQWGDSHAKDTRTFINELIWVL